MNLQLQIIDLLQASLFRPLVLVATAWLILRLLRVRHPASRHAVWTAVLIGMLVLPIISVVTPDWTLRVLPWSQDAVQGISASTTPAVVADDNQTEAATLPILSEAATAGDPAASIAPPSVETLIAWAYMAGLAAMLAYRLMGWLFLRRVISRSRALRPACLRESADVVTPVAVGVFFPSVILPTGWRTWNARTKRAVLAHEFAHLHRRDTVVAALARLVKSVFWFHPAAWWVSRQTSDMAELACDAVALQRVGDPAGYSRVLVEFASAVTRTRPRVALPGLAIASSSRMGERIDQVFELWAGQMRKLPRPGVSLIAMGLPALTLAATVVLSAADPARDTGASVGQDREAGQSVASKPRFEAATIKPCAPEETPASGGARGAAGGTNAATSPGRFTVPCVTTEQLIYLAYASYGVKPEEQLQNDDPGTASSAQKIRGGPDWVHSSRDKYTIEAIAPGVTERTTLMGSMLQTLLEERFQLKLHRESEEVPMFALTVAKSGFKLKPMNDGECDPDDGSPSDVPGAKPKCGNLMMMNGGGVSRWTFSGSPISSLASMLSRSLGVHVIDRTNITDRFMMQFTFFKPDGSSVIRDGSGRDVTDTVLGGPSVDQALNDQLGLKLDRIKAPREHIVIDQIQRPAPDDLPRNQTSAPAQAQPAASQVKFDVISIKPCSGITQAAASMPAQPGLRRGGAAGWHAQTSPGNVRWDCVTLATLIDQAFADRDHPLLNMAGDSRPQQPAPVLSTVDKPKRVRGGPSWIETDKFTIEARASLDVTNPALQGSSTRNLAALPAPMSQALRAALEDRFQLKVRRATEQQDMYRLTVAKNGLNKERMKPMTPGDCVTSSQYVAADPAARVALRICGNYFVTRNSWEMSGNTMQQLADALSSAMDLYVVDRTAVPGPFTFVLDLSERGTQPDDTFIRALEKLGLQIERTKGPAEYLVIDRVQKPRPDAPASATGSGNRR